MSFSAASLLAASLLYLVILFAIAWVTEKGTLLRHWVRHPLVYTLSLGVYAGIWAVYAAVGVAADSGYGFLAYYLGISGAFLLAPVLLNPVLRIGRATSSPRWPTSSLIDIAASGPAPWSPCAPAAPSWPCSACRFRRLPPQQHSCSGHLAPGH